MINRYRQFIAGAAVAAMALSGCGTVASDAAITVGDNTVSMDLVDELSSLDEFKNDAANGPGLVSTADGRTGGASYRSAATFLVQLELLGVLVDRFDAQISESDRAPVEGFDGVSEPFVEHLTEFNARASAVSRVLAEQTPTDAERRIYYDTQRERFTDLTCIDGISVPAALAETVRSSLDEGQSYVEIAEANPQAAQLIAPPGEVNCLGDDEIGDPALIADIDAAALGDVVEFEQQDQTGAEFIVFIGVQDRGDLDFDDVFVQTTIDNLFVSAETSFEAWVGIAAYQSGVDVDPRLGTFNLVTIQVDPPPVPGQPVTTPSPLG